MRAKRKSKTILIFLIVSALCLCIAAVFLSACSVSGPPVKPDVTTDPAGASEAAPALASASLAASPSGRTAGIVYHDADYGFDLNLRLRIS